VYINLTPHPIHLYGTRSVHEGPYETIPPSGTVCRLATIDLGSQNGYELVEYGRAHDLPASSPDVMYIVSLVVALAVHRDDLLAPYIEVRNEEGTMIGCRYLQKVV
jgi:hypothetical protein